MPQIMKVHVHEHAFIYGYTVSSAVSEIRCLARRHSSVETCVNFG